MPFYSTLFVFVCAAAVIGVRGVTLNIVSYFSLFSQKYFKILFKQEECDDIFDYCDSVNNVQDSGPTEVKKDSVLCLFAIIFIEIRLFYVSGSGRIRLLV